MYIFDILAAGVNSILRVTGELYSTPDEGFKISFVMSSEELVDDTWIRSWCTVDLSYMYISVPEGHSNGAVRDMFSMIVKVGDSLTMSKQYRN